MMNNVLELKGKRFVQASKSGNGGGAAMNGKKSSDKRTIDCATI